MQFRTTSLKRVCAIPRDALGGLTRGDFKAAAFQDSQFLESHLPNA